MHACVSAVCGHTAPPFSGSTLVRERDWKPLPQDLVHVDQTDGNVPTTQLTGHAWLLHERDSLTLAHALPPAVG